MSLLVLLLLPAALHPRGRLREEVAILAEDSLKDAETGQSQLEMKNHFITTVLASILKHRFIDHTDLSLIRI